MGMTYDEYWYGESDRVKYVREGFRIRCEQQNRMMWIQGMYVYEALCDASPIFHDLAKPGTKAKEYAEKPYPFFEDHREQVKMRENQRKLTQGLEFFRGKMMAHNKRFSSAKKEGSEEHGSNH